MKDQTLVGLVWLKKPAEGEILIVLLDVRQGSKNCCGAKLFPKSNMGRIFSSIVKVGVELESTQFGLGRPCPLEVWIHQEEGAEDVPGILGWLVGTGDGHDQEYGE